MHTVYFEVENSSSCLCDLTGHVAKILFVDNLFGTDKQFEETGVSKINLKHQ